MATRRTNAAMTMDEAANSTARPGKVAAFIPVDANGTPTNADADDWRMQVGGENELSTDVYQDDEITQTPADRVISMLADVENDQRAYVKVSRVVAGSKVNWCDDYSAATFEAGGYKMIRDQWGPGEYQVLLYGTVPGTKKFTIRTRATVQIEAPLIAPVAQQPQSELSQLVAQLAANQQAMLEALTNKPAVNPMESMKEMFTMMTMMRTAMGIDTAPKKENALGDIVAAMRELREVSEEFSPNGKPAGPMEMVKDMLPMIASAMQARQSPTSAQTAPQVTSQPAVALPASVTASIHIPPAESEEMKLSEIMKQKGYLATLVQMGKDGRQTDEAAIFVADNLSDDLIDLMARDDWFDMFKAIAGDIEPQREWFHKVRDEALALFEVDSDNQSLPAQ